VQYCGLSCLFANFSDGSSDLTTLLRLMQADLLDMECSSCSTVFIQIMTLCSCKQCAITSSQGNSGFSPKGCSWFCQCWRMGTTLTRLSLGYLTKTCVVATWNLHKLEKTTGKMEQDQWPNYKKAILQWKRHRAAVTKIGWKTNSANLQLCFVKPLLLLLFYYYYLLI